MRRRAICGVLLGMSLAGLPAAFAADPTLGVCTKYGQAPANSTTSVSSKPAKLCALECVATGTNGSAAAWDSPDGTTSHAQAKVVADVGAATLGNMGATGAIERYTEFGLMIQTGNCVATYSWVD